MIEIYLNDRKLSLSANATLAELIDSYATSLSTVAAVNGDFVPRSQHRHYQLQGGDRVELLAPMEGG